jgi:asparagine synthase (glutamine-hydrolysing)
MCGIIGVVRRPADREPPSPAELLALVDDALAAFPDASPLEAADTLLRGVPGVRALLDTPSLAADLRSRVDELDRRLSAREAELDAAPAGTDVEAINAELVRLKDAVWANDRPGMVDVDSSLLLFCREIKKEATVALSGESADEIFGGYPWFRSEESLVAQSFPWARMVAERSSLLSPELSRLLSPEDYVAERYQDALSEVPRLPGENALAARRRELFYLNITRFMPTLLDRKGRMSMACGLEVRVPYCDHRLVEYVWNIPWEIKMTGGMEKGVLRRALAGLLPEAVLTRRKSPYPKTHNPKYLAATKRWLTEIIADPTSPILQLVDVKTVKRVIQEDAAGFNPSWFGQLMGSAQLFAYLAQVDTWLRKYRITITC